MLYYRLYFMHAHTGHIERFAEFEAPDHASAIELAREHEGSMPLELWQGHDKVRRFEAVAGASRLMAASPAS